MLILITVRKGEMQWGRPTEGLHSEKYITQLVVSCSKSSTDYNLISYVGIDGVAVSAALPDDFAPPECAYDLLQLVPDVNNTN